MSLNIPKAKPTPAPRARGYPTSWYNPEADGIWADPFVPGCWVSCLPSSPGRGSPIAVVSPECLFHQYVEPSFCLTSSLDVRQMWTKCCMDAFILSNFMVLKTYCPSITNLPRIRLWDSYSCGLSCSLVPPIRPLIWFGLNPFCRQAWIWGGGSWKWGSSVCSLRFNRQRAIRQRTVTEKASRQSQSANVRRDRAPRLLHSESEKVFLKGETSMKIILGSARFCSASIIIP